MIKKIISTLITILYFTAIFAESPTWMRYPAISPDGSKIAFSYKGDIYTVGIQGGTATRLTTHTAFDSNPVWSPDGNHIAFVSDRKGGSKNIYIMKSVGSIAKQLTKHSATEKLHTFTPDGKFIVFSSHYQDPASSALFPTGRLSEVYKVPISGGKIEQILASPADHIQFNQAGSKFIYQDIKGFENTWRKHHTSSVTRDILEYDIESNSHKKLVNWVGEDTNPNYSPDEKTLFFLSERSGSYNVYSAPIYNATQATQLTHFTEHPVRFLTVAKNGTMAFGYDGEIYTLATNLPKPQKLNIVIRSDVANEQLKKFNFTSGATSAANSPNGKQIAFTVRGDVFVTATDYNTTKRITHTVAEETDVDFGADNRSLVYASYRDGFWNIYTAKIARKEDPNFANGTMISEKPLIPNDETEKQHPKFSPDGKEVAFVQNRTKLMVYNLDSKQLREITDGTYQHESDGDMTFEWSPDGKWFALEYVSNNHAPYTNIGIVSAKGGEDVFDITNSGYFNNNPHWVMGGNAILFSSELYGMRNHASWGSMRDVMIVFVNREAYNKYKMSKEEYELYRDAEKEKKKEISDKKEKETSAKSAKKKKKADTDKDKKENSKEKPIVIDFDNMNERIVRLTPNSSQLGDAMIDKEGKKLYYLSAFEGGFDMWVHDLREKSTKLLHKLNSGWSSFSTDKELKKLFLLNGQKMQTMEFSNEKFKGITYRAEMKLDAAKERDFMYNYVCREEKERFYDVAMHNVNWEKLTTHYRKFLPHISNNYDFSEMLSELLGELNVSHTGSGYRAASTNDKTAELGLFVHRNTHKNGLIIDEIVVNGPFDYFQSKVKTGDIIEKIDGNNINDSTDYYPYLEGKSGKNTLISLYSPTSGKRWEEVVKPINAQRLNGLLYKRWIKQREADVERLSGGKLGYVHIQSMGDGSFREMYSNALGKYYQKEGIVIDIRYNGGGRLHEDLEVFFGSHMYLQQVVRGKNYCEMPSRRWNKPSIMLMNEMDYSNAHGSPWVYKHTGIGKLVGMPVPGTMTSVNWVTLQDRSLYFGIPVVGYKKADGTYLENDQLEPDVTAPLNLVEAVKGRDTQLETAVNELLKEL